MTEKKKSPAFQFYPDEWLTDRIVAMMTPEQEGAYIRLVCYCWLDNDLSLPDNDEQLSVLARISKCGLELVKSKFKPHPIKEGFLTHSRLQKEYKKQLAWREKSAKGGKKSAAQRTENKQKLKGGSICLQPKSNTPSPSPSPTTYKKESKKESSLSNFEEFWKSWIPYKTPKGSKSDAREAYLKIRKEIDHETLITISGEYCRLCETTDTNTKNVFRWLKKRGWEDDCTIPNRTSQSASNGKPSYSSTILNAAERARQQLSLRKRTEGESSIFDTEGSEDCSLLPPPGV